MQTALISALTFLIGLFIGHRLALWRDIRKEFNANREPISAWLDSAATHSLPYPAAPSKHQVDDFVSYLRWPAKKSFRKELDIYQAGLMRSEYTHQITGTTKYQPDEALEAAVDKMRKLIQRK